MKRKFANLPNWPRLIKKRFAMTHLQENDFKGYVSIVHIDKVTRPLVIKVADRELCLVDDGYVWTQYFPRYSKYSLTAMFDRELQVVEWYFDICLGNNISYKGIPYFDDLYLDVVVLPTGEVTLLDEEELQEALNNGHISKRQFDMAWLEAKNLMESIRNGENTLLERSKKDVERLMELPTR